MMKREKIFVSCASYRDELCTKTLESLFTNAEFPENVVVGICQQNADSDSNCVNSNIDILNRYKNNIKTIYLKHIDAKGPTWARYLCSTLFSDEDYFFQIDSHSLFAKNWDTKLINMIKNIKKQTGHNKIVISHYPKTYEEFELESESSLIEVPRICKSFFNDRGMISFEGAEHLKVDKNTFVETPYIAAGMMFCEKNFLKDVPFDPYLDYLFVGEEILHSIRAWTSGYNIYSSSENIVFHYYTREDSPKIWTDKTYSDEDAFNKVKYLINLSQKEDIPEHITHNIEHYGLGNVRSLQDYYNFAGIDLQTQKVSKNFCRKNLIEEFGSIESFQNNTNIDILKLFIILICLYLFIKYIRLH